MNVLWFVGGVLVGWAQAVLLLKDAQRRGSVPTMLLRLVMVAAVLVPAALSGHLLGATAGWLGGHLVSVVVLARRLS